MDYRATYNFNCKITVKYRKEKEPYKTNKNQLKFVHTCKNKAFNRRYPILTGYTL